MLWVAAPMAAAGAIRNYYVPIGTSKMGGACFQSHIQDLQQVMNAHFDLRCADGSGCLAPLGKVSGSTLNVAWVSLSKILRCGLRCHESMKAASLIAKTESMKAASLIAKMEDARHCLALGPQVCLRSGSGPARARSIVLWIWRQFAANFLYHT